MACSWVLFMTLTLAVVLDTAEAITCHVCTGEDCADPFVTDYTDSFFKFKLEGCSYCTKIKKQGQVARSCLGFGDGIDGVGAGCEQRQESKNVHAEFCQCTTELCNSATYKTSALTLIAMTTVTSFYLKL